MFWRIRAAVSFPLPFFHDVLFPLLHLCCCEFEVLFCASRGVRLLLLHMLFSVVLFDVSCASSFVLLSFLFWVLCRVCAGRFVAPPFLCSLLNDRRRRVFNRMPCSFVVLSRFALRVILAFLDAATSLACLVDVFPLDPRFRWRRRVLVLVQFFAQGSAAGLHATFFFSSASFSHFFVVRVLFCCCFVPVPTSGLHPLLLHRIGPPFAVCTDASERRRRAVKEIEWLGF